MPDVVLVAYATRYGSTKEVAEEVAATLRQGGLQTDGQPAQQVRSVEPYRSVVLGTPLYIGRWLKDARRFVARHQQALAARPVDIFSLGPTHSGEQELQAARPQVDQMISTVPWLKPVSVELFGGKYNPAALRFPDTLPASPLHKAPPSDARDWEAIRAWGAGLVSKL